MKTTILFFAIATFSSLNTLAQQTTEPPKKIEDLSMEELMNIAVVTASQSEQKVSEAPATIYVITEEQIHDRGYSNLEELLEDIPEIEIQRKSSSETSNFYTIRGIGGNEKFLIMLDGVRINAVDGTPHVVGVNYPLTNIKQVEVMLGPASALYGVNGFSAIINLFTKKGTDIKGLNVNVNGGSFTTTNYGVAAGFEKKDVSFHIAGNLYHSDEPFFPKYYKDDFSWYNNNYSQDGGMRLAPFAPNVIVPTNTRPYQTPTDAYMINSGINLKKFEIGYYRNSESHNSSMGMRPDYNVYQRDAIYKVNQETVFARHDFQSDNNKYSLKSYFAYSSFNLDPNSKFVNTFSSYHDAYKYAFNKSFTIREQFTFQANENSSLIGGLNVQTFSSLAKTGDLPFKFNTDLPADQQGFYYLGTNTFDKNGNDLTIYQNFYFINESNVGLFGQYQQKFAKIIEATLAARYDHNSRYGAVFNPRASFVIAPSNSVKFKLIYGQAYLAPSPYLAYQHYGSFITVDVNGNPSFIPSNTVGLTGPFWHLPNPGLQPEKLKTFEFAASYVKNSFALSADAYYNDLNNLIANKLDFNLKFKSIDVQAVESPTNQGNAYAYGFTFKVDFSKQIGQAKLQGYGAYSFSDGKTDGAPLAYSAKNTIKGGVVLKVGKFSIDPRVIYRSASNQGFLKDASGNYEHNNSFWLINIYSCYRITKNFEINIKVRNLLDSRYYNVSYGGSEAFAATPQDPFSVYGGIAAKF